MRFRPVALATSLLAVAACSPPDDPEPSWDGSIDPVEAARDCVFTTIGTTWQRGTCSPVFEGVASWESGGIGGYDVEAFDVLGGTGYLMLYTGVGGTGLDEDPRVIALAASMDGIRWSRFAEGPVLEPEDPAGQLSVGCTATRWRDATLHLWLVDEGQRIFHAVSLDGADWVVDPSPVEGLVGQSGERFVSFEGCSAAWDEAEQRFDVWWSGVVRRGVAGGYTYTAEVVHSTASGGADVALDGEDAHFAPSGTDESAFDHLGFAEPGIACLGAECAMLYAGWSRITVVGSSQVLSGPHQLGLALSHDGGRTWERSGDDLSFLAPSEDGEEVDRPRPVFAAGRTLVFLQDNFGLASQPELAIALVASGWPPGAEVDP